MMRDVNENGIINLSRHWNAHDNYENAVLLIVLTENTSIAFCIPYILVFIYPHSRKHQ